MRYLGRTGYINIVRSIMHTRDALRDGITSMDELYLVSDPEGPIMAFGARDIDIVAVAQAMTERGWFVTQGSEPPCIHLGMLTAIHVPHTERYLQDLRDAVAEVVAGRKATGSREVTYGG